MKSNILIKKTAIKNESKNRKTKKILIPLLNACQTYLKQTKRNLFYHQKILL